MGTHYNRLLPTISVLSQNVKNINFFLMKTLNLYNLRKNCFFIWACFLNASIQDSLYIFIDPLPCDAVSLKQFRDPIFHFHLPLFSLLSLPFLQYELLLSSLVHVVTDHCFTNILPQPTELHLNLLSHQSFG